MALLHLMYRNSEVVMLLVALEFSVSTDEKNVAMSPKLKGVIADIERILAAASE